MSGGAAVPLLLMALALGTPGEVAAPKEMPSPTWMINQPRLHGWEVYGAWSRVPGAVKYIVYLDGRALGETEGFQYRGPAPAEPGEHRYSVSAVDAAGKESPLSEPGVVKVPAALPAPPK